MHKHTLLNFIKINILISITVSLFFLPSQKTIAGDLMEQAFDQSAAHEQVIDIGQTKNAVGNEVFHESVGASRKSGEGFKVERKQGLLVNATKLLMRIAVVLAIPMIIVNGIMLALIATGRVAKEITGYIMKIIYITAGLAIILSAIAVISLIQSGTVSTVLKIF